MKFSPTDSQKDAINSKGSVIVTAAAGSGKTAVLVERVIKLLCDENNPVSADRILIVTFTNAAAAEMKGRIEKRLAQECEKHPENINLLKQQLIIQSADICTIDSFCIRLVRNYANILKIPSDFKIADDSVSQKIAEDVLSEIFSEKFEEGNDEFVKFLSSINSVYGDGAGKEAIKNLYRFCSKMPYPEEWLHNCVKNYDFDSNNENKYTNCIFEKFISELTKACGSIADIKSEICLDELLKEKVDPSALMLEDVLNKLLKQCKAKEWDLVFELLRFDMPAFPRLRKGTKYNDDILEFSKEAFNSVIKVIKKYKNIFCVDFKGLKSEFYKQKSVISQMSDLCTEFSDRYLKEHIKKSVLTFEQIEKFAFKLLTAPYEQNEEGSILKEIVSRYDDVLVDEYQDVNSLQNELFNIISDNSKKLFTVGDAKQSIYRFRGTDPMFFINRQKSAEKYSPELSNESLKRIILSKNFRSKKGICNFTNGLFYEIMSEDLGSIDYNEDEFLYTVDESDDIDSDVHVQIIELKDDKKPTEAEAEYIADYIYSSINGRVNNKTNLSDISDKNPKYSDFAILGRNGTNFKKYCDALKKRGIPVSLGGGDYFKTTEIMTITALLKSIASPMDDIALLSTMMSPIFGFTADELAAIKTNKKERLFSAVAACKTEKCINFLKTLSEYKNKSVCMPVSQVIYYILETSGYYQMVSAMNDGKRRTGNLQMLISMAEGFSGDTAGDLSDFLRYLEYIKTTNKTTSATVNDSNSVNIITIHASKGLQFPVCFLAGSTSYFNSNENKSDILYSDNLGIALNIFDDEANKKTETVSRKLIVNENLALRCGEEQRLLYVALTRAEKKMIIPIPLSSPEKRFIKEIKAVSSGISENGRLKPETVLECKSYSDMILKYIVTLPAILKICDDYDICNQQLYSINNRGCSENISISLSDGVFETNSETEAPLLPEKPDKNYMEYIKTVFEYKYPYEDLRKIQAKTSVSSLTKNESSYEYCAVQRPGFLSNIGLTPTERGTALHKFMQFADFKSASNNIQNEIKRLENEKFISMPEAEAIDIKRVEAFFNTEIFKRLLKSRRVLKEQRFMTSVKAGEIYDNLDSNLSKLSVIVQGAVDCMFFEDDEIVLIDFKTDKTKSEDYLLEHYSEQLRFYSSAVKKMFELPVKECYIYSINMDKFIPVKI